MNVENTAETIMDKLSQQSFDGYEVFAYLRDHALTRYANSVIHQQVQSQSHHVRIRVHKGKRMLAIDGSVNMVDDMIQDLTSGINSAPELSFFHGFAEKQSYSTVNASGKIFDADERGEIVQQAVNYGTDLDKDALLYGKVEVLDFSYAIQNSNGVKGSHTFNFNDIKILSIIEENGKRGYGREVTATRDPSKLNIEEMAKSAVKISRDTLTAKNIEPGDYPVVLRPVAAIELIDYSFSGLEANDFHQKNSAFSDKIGEQMVSEKLTVEDAPLNPNSLLATPFDGDGIAKKNTTLVDQGVPKTVFYDLMSASQFLDDKNMSSGHAAIPYSDYIFGGAAPSAISVKPGDATEQEMIEDTKKGLLIQTFWYSNTVNAPKGMITGLTRDGLYLIEDGEIKHAVKNMRYTDSFLNFFNAVDMIEKKQHSIFGEFSGGSLIPMFKLDKLRFTGQSKH